MQPLLTSGDEGVRISLHPVRAPFVFKAIIVAVITASIATAAITLFSAHYRIFIDGQNDQYRSAPWRMYVARLGDTGVPPVGALIVLSAQRNPLVADGTFLLKRLVAAPGDRVDVADDSIRVIAPDGTVRASASRNPDVLRWLHDRGVPTIAHGTYTVTPDALWVIGSGERSLDSRYLGPMPITALRGRAWPLF